MKNLTGKDHHQRNLTWSDADRERARETLKDAVPIAIDLPAIKRSATPDDLVGTVAFLASDDSAFVTGQTLNVDSGQAMH